jgi:hypothetical protein
MQPFTMERLPYVGGGRTRICVPLIELSLRTVMRWVPTPEYMLLGVNRLLRPCHILTR